MPKKKLTKKQKRSKYNVSLTDNLEYNGVKFRSKLEVNHYKLFLEHPKIKVVEFEPYFLLLEPFEYYDLEKDKIRKYGKWSYKADFLLEIEGLDKKVVWESKGMIKPEYALRRKMWYKLYGEDYYYITSKSLKHAKQLLEELDERIKKMVKKKYKTVTKEVYEKVIVSAYCDGCEKEFEIDELYNIKNNHYNVTIGHYDWGNDSGDSREELHFCSYDCMANYQRKYFEDASGTEYFEISNDCWN